MCLVGYKPHFWFYKLHIFIQILFPEFHGLRSGMKDAYPALLVTWVHPHLIFPLGNQNYVYSSRKYYQYFVSSELGGRHQHWKLIKPLHALPTAAVDTSLCHIISYFYIYFHINVQNQFKIVLNWDWIIFYLYYFFLNTSLK